MKAAWESNPNSNGTKRHAGKIREGGEVKCSVRRINVVEKARHDPSGGTNEKLTTIIVDGS